jgi:ergothioneine biosynthesis protein EgtC
MCRLLGYFGTPTPLDRLLYKPSHSLIVQSYQPREMTAGLLNADGFGVGWHHPHQPVPPFIYKNILPIWNDINLPSLSRYIESGSIVANVRSATPGLAIDLSNCQPFQHHSLLAIHNGFIANFRQTLYRPIRQRLSDEAYQAIYGNTDSEHIFGLLLDELHRTPSLSLTEALHQTLQTLSKLANQYETDFSANMVLNDGKQLVACRYANRDPVPTLYWLRDDPLFPDAVLVASEPLFEADWKPFGDRSILTVDHDLTIQTHSL